MDNKGQGLSIGAVVTMALAVIVLLMVATFFSGGFTAMGEKMQNFSASATGDQESLDKHASYTKCITTCLKYASGEMSETEYQEQLADGCTCPT